MLTLARIVRSLALAVLFAGSGAVVFAAVVLVKAATAAGVPVAAAAASNAPVFIHFGKVALAFAVLLVAAECVDLFGGGKKTLVMKARFCLSGMAAVLAMVYSLVIVPPMEQLLPQINTLAAAHEEFQRLHELSRLVFGSSILASLLALVATAWEGAATKSSAAVTLEREVARQR